MSSSASTIVFAIFAVVVIGALLVVAFVYDRHRSKEVRDDVPERIAEGLHDPAARHRSTEVLHEDTGDGEYGEYGRPTQNGPG